MPTDDIRISDWSLLASAGVTASLQFTSPTALTSLTVYTGGTVTDVDDLTGATAYAGTLSGGNLIATVSLPVPTSDSTPLRLAVNGVVQSVGRLHPSTVGATVPDNTITLVAGTNTFALTILGVVSSGGGGGITDGDKGDITVTAAGTVWTIDAGVVTAAKVAADVATQAELDAEAVLARNADNLTSGTVADARIPAAIARDAEVAAAYQPLDSDLTAIAALATTATGRSLLAAADAAAIRAIAGAVGLTGNETVAGVKTFSSEPSAPTYKATGNTGALTTPITLTGANATGAPTTGAHVKGEVAGDDTGKLWYCTVAGTPGTWVQVGGSGGVSDGDKGDITVTGSGATWTIDNDAVTLAKLANIATARILGRVTAASGDPEELTAAQAKSILAVVGDWSALGNLGATETVTGIDDTFVRSAGTLDMACTVTITTTADQVIDLQLTQDATGRRAVTWAGVNAWRTVSGTAPDLSDRLAGEVDRFFFENIAGSCIGYWLTESLIVPRQFAISASWYPAAPVTGTTAALTFGFPYFEPFFVSTRMTLEAVGAWVSVAAGGSTIVAAVYNDDDGGLPGTRILDVNSGAAWSGGTSSTFVSTTALTTVLEPGMYWMGYLALTGSPTITATSGHLPGNPTTGTPAGGGSNLRETTGGRTSLPADVSAYAYTSVTNAPFFWLRRS